MLYVIVTLWFDTPSLRSLSCHVFQNKSSILQLRPGSKDAGSLCPWESESTTALVSSLLDELSSQICPHQVPVT